VNRTQIDRLLSGVPENVDARLRHRVEGYVATARRCDEQIDALRIELECALRALDDAAASGADEEAAADEALRVARELDVLERVQPRIDSWLRVAVGGLTHDIGPGPFGEGPA
jgi:hypothetical protein